MVKNSHQYFKILLLLLVIFSGSCKKAIDKYKEDLLIKLITENTWKIVRYLDASSNQTSVYAAYDFKFNKDGTLIAIFNGNTEATGTWVGSEVTQSITSEFPNAGEPLSRLNGMWIITNTKSQPWRVFSHRFEGNTEYVLDLQEK